MNRQEFQNPSHSNPYFRVQKGCDCHHRTRYTTVLDDCHHLQLLGSLYQNQTPIRSLCCYDYPLSGDCPQRDNSHPIYEAPFPYHQYHRRYYRSPQLPNLPEKLFRADPVEVGCRHTSKVQMSSVHSLAMLWLHHFVRLWFLRFLKTVANASKRSYGQDSPFARLY